MRRKCLIPNTLQSIMAWTSPGCFQNCFSAHFFLANLDYSQKLIPLRVNFFVNEKGSYTKKKNTIIIFDTGKIFGSRK